MKKTHGIDNPLEWYNNFWTNEKTGLGIINSYGCLFGIVYLIFISLGMIITSFVKSKVVSGLLFFISVFGIPFVISILICHYLITKNDEFLNYFAEFKKWTKVERRINILLSIGFIGFTIFIFFQSLMNLFQ